VKERRTHGSDLMQVDGETTNAPTTIAATAATDV
jgi:hypothetical protein